MSDNKNTQKSTQKSTHTNGKGEQSDVQQVLADLSTGKTTIEKVEAFFRTRTWPEEPTASRDEDMSADFMAIPKGSFHEVKHAYISNVISYEQYERLHKAVAETTTG